MGAEGLILRNLHECQQENLRLTDQLLALEKLLLEARNGLVWWSRNDQHELVVRIDQALGHG